MKVLILYKPNSEHSRKVEEYVEELKKRVIGTSIRIELLNANTRDGMATASIYDIFSFPTIMVLRMDGSVQKSWEGENLPLFDEIQAYASA